MAADYKDLAEHVNVLMGIIAVLTGGLVALLWYFLKEIRADVREIKNTSYECQKTLPEKFVTAKTFDDWKPGRDELWGALNNHSHDVKTGRVIR